MGINSQLSTIKSKGKLSKQAEQKQNHRCGDHLEVYQFRGGEGNRGRGAGIKKYKLVGTKQTGVC